jgi:glycosyltransferase involved in cell wall biosynthesis
MSNVDSSRLAVVVMNNSCTAQGGASRVAIDEALGLALAGHRVTFVGAAGPISAELLNAPLKVICLGQQELARSGGNPAVMLQGLWNRAAYGAVSSVLATHDASRTVVHLHGFPQALSTSPVRCALNRGFKVVCTLHDFFSACPNGGFFDFVSREPCARKALSVSCITTNCDKRRYSHKLYRVARAAVQLHFGHLPGGVKHYISLSRRSEELLRPYLPRDARIYPLENPVEAVKKTPVAVERNRMVVAVGRLDIEKGIEVLLDAIRHSDMHLTLIGDGPLRGRAEASGICRVTGWLSREAVATELEAARCLIFPSLWYETYGLAVAEAAGRGVPAIVSNICAAAERVKDGVTGWHARAGDVSDLKRCLSIIKDDEVVRSAGQAAYDSFWLKPPTRERHVAELEAVYREILRSPTGRG